VMSVAACVHSRLHCQLDGKLFKSYTHHHMSSVDNYFSIH
jgi:hypothetical protein